MAAQAGIDATSICAAIKAYEQGNDNHAASQADAAADQLEAGLT